MKKITAKSLVVQILIILFFSCDRKEEPVNSTVSVMISGLELVGVPSSPSSKLSGNETWIHDLERKLLLTFESSTGEKFSSEINPNDFSVPYRITLPLGSYRLIGNSSVTDPFSLLTIEIDQNLIITNSDQKLVLEANSAYGLFTITNENLGENAPLFLGINKELKSKGNFYFGYAPATSAMTIQIPLANQASSFNFIWEPKPFTHRHISLDNPTNPNDLTSFIPADFTLEQSTILLSDKGIPTSLTPNIIAELPDSQNENSGLAYLQNRLFSINDGGNTNDIFELNPASGEVIRTINVTNAINTDWEELAQSETHLYIGDFGNNNGTRKNLTILKIPITAILTSTEVSAEELKFTFEDQTDFTGNQGLHNYDCEAFFFANNLLHLFTKNRADQKTNHYTVNPSQSNGLAKKIETFDVKGLITAAEIDNQGNICLLGYEDAGFSSRSFVWLFSDYVGGAYFSGNSTKIFLGSPALLSQTEGIIFNQEGELIISGEKISFSGVTIPAKLSKIDLRGLF